MVFTRTDHYLFNCIIPSLPPSALSLHCQPMWSHTNNHPSIVLQWAAQGITHSRFKIQDIKSTHWEAHRKIAQNFPTKMLVIMVVKDQGQNCTYILHPFCTHSAWLLLWAWQWELWWNEPITARTKGALSTQQRLNNPFWMQVKLIHRWVHP